MICRRLAAKCYQNSTYFIVARDNSTVTTIKSFVRFAKARIGEWKSLKVPPRPTRKPLKNRYIPLSKRFLFRELISDSTVVSPSSKDAFDNMALFIDGKISDQYRLRSEEITLLLQPLIAGNKTATTHTSTDLGGDQQYFTLGRKERLDHEYWFLRKLEEIAPNGGFSEVPQESLQTACLPRKSRASRVKTYVDPADYDVLRVWTRGLHPSGMYPIDRSLRNRPANDLLSTVSVGRSRGIAERWINRLTRLVTPKALAVVSPYDDLCYGHVLVAHRLKNDDLLRLRMMKHVPVSASASSNLFAEGILDTLPEHRFLGLSQVARNAVLATGAIGLAGLGVVTPLAFLGACSSPELVLAWCVSAACTAAATGATVSLRYWKARADWSERLRKLSLACEFNSGRFALAHLLGLSQAETFKAALLVYGLLLQPSECHTPLKRVQLEIRAESWIAKRLSHQLHVGLPSPFSRVLHPFSKTKGHDDGAANALPVISSDRFTGGSGPLFDLQFDAGPGLQVLRQLDLVHGSDEEGWEAVPLASRVPETVQKSTLSAFLSPESQEDDLGFPRVEIQK